MFNHIIVYMFFFLFLTVIYLPWPGGEHGLDRWGGGEGWGGAHYQHTDPGPRAWIPYWVACRPQPRPFSGRVTVWLPDINNIYHTDTARGVVRDVIRLPTNHNQAERDARDCHLRV